MVGGDECLGNEELGPLIQEVVLCLVSATIVAALLKLTYVLLDKRVITSLLCIAERHDKHIATLYQRRAVQSFLLII